MSLEDWIILQIFKMRIFPELEFQPGLMKLEKYEKILGESEHKHPKEQAQYSITFFWSIGSP